MGNNLIAATLDIDYLANLNIRGGDRGSLDVLNLKNPYAYFQAGVMVFNTAELPPLSHTVPEWLHVQPVIFIYNDQDILNSECQVVSSIYQLTGTLRIISLAVPRNSIQWHQTAF